MFITDNLGGGAEFGIVQVSVDSARIGDTFGTNLQPLVTVLELK